MFYRLRKKLVASWEGTISFFNSIFSQPKLFWKHQNELLSKNFEREEALKQARDFEIVLQEWGITTEDELDAEKEIRNGERISGLCICIGGICLMIWDSFSTSAFYWRTLQEFFYLSLTLLGGFIFLACTWRLQVFTHRKFVPFLVWVRRGGHI